MEKSSSVIIVYFISAIAIAALVCIASSYAPFRLGSVFRRAQRHIGSREVADEVLKFSETVKASGLRIMDYAVSPDSGGRKGDSRLFLIGFDGASWNVMLPLINSGRLPHFRELMDRGSSGNIRCGFSSSSPVIWTSIITGKKPEQHGITDFFIRVKGEDSSKPAMSTLRKVDALWAMASGRGRQVAVVRPWASYPAEQVNGVNITQRFIDLCSENADVANDKRLTYPPALADAIRRAVPQPRMEAMARNCFDMLGDFSMRNLSLPEVMHANIRSFRLHMIGDLFVHLLTMDIVRERPPDLLFSYYLGIDPASHVFWKYYEPWGQAGGSHVRFEVNAAERDAFGRIIPLYYELMDAFLGQIVMRMPTDANIMVLTDHGLSISRDKYFYKANALLAALGYLSFDAAGAVDQARTRLYDEGLMPWQPHRTFYVRTSGIENNAADKPSAEDIVKSATSRLTSLKTVDGKAVLKHAFPTEDFTMIKAEFNQALVEEDKVNLEGGTFPVRKFKQSFHWSGDHQREGAFIVAGPDIRSGVIINDVDVLDVVPTALTLMGLPVAEDLPGRVLTEIMNKEYLSRSPIQKIASYEGLSPVEEEKDLAPDTMEQFSKELRDKLKALGYIQ
ncbi:MAG: alkaline phosphatase family protein [bacterium]|nr:alkaline phosphatase family protein [bacterium]